jgi:hypothetical protein
MQDPTAYFPQLRAQCAPLGRQPQRAARAVASLSGLADLCGHFFPGLLVPAKKGAGSRQRALPRTEVFWAFLGQVLEPGASCRRALVRLQAAALAAGRRVPGSTSAYCQARRALPLAWLQALFAALGQWFEPRTSDRWRGRAVRVIDGTGFSMADTQANRQAYPYGPKQAPGCGFPTGKLVGLFCLHSGRLLSFVTGPWQHHDLFFARKLLKALRPGELLLADRAYCGWVFFALLQRAQVDFLIRLPRPGAARSRCRKSSWWESWPRPQRRPEDAPSQLRRLPKELLVRIVRARLHRRGFRSETLFLVTSLTDEQRFPTQALFDLYARRWQVELHFRQLKTNLALDILRGLSPALTARELWMHALAYNLIRALILEAALIHQLPVDRFSFQGTLHTLHAWSAQRSLRRRPAARRALLLRLASDLVPFRPLRSEPRARKRRPKHYPHLLQPRQLWHRRHGP